MKARILVLLFGFLLAGKLSSQTFTIDSIAIDEVNSRLLVFSSNLDFAHAYVFVLKTRLAPAQKINGGFSYVLPDSGNGSMGNISVIAGGEIDSNWKITLWTETITYRDTMPDSIYTSSPDIMPYWAHFPPSRIVKYYFYFRTADRMNQAAVTIRCPNLNRRSHAQWNFNGVGGFLYPGTYSLGWAGSGDVPVTMDSTNTAYSGNDSISFTYGKLRNLACSYSYSSYMRTVRHIIDSGSSIQKLDSQHVMAKMTSSGLVTPGKIMFKEQVGLGALDSPATTILSWSILTSQSPYSNPLKLSAGTPVTSSYSALLPNYPNPVGSLTTIPFRLAEGSPVTIEVHDALGRTCAVIANGYYEAGNYEVKFNAEHLPSGIYYATMKTEKRTFTERVVVSR